MTGSISYHRTDGRGGAFPPTSIDGHGPVSVGRDTRDTPEVTRV